MPTYYPTPVLWDAFKPVPVQNSDGNWCPPVILPMFWQDTVNLTLCKTLMGTDAHLLPCPCSENKLSTCPCSKLWWEQMPTCYPTHESWKDTVYLSLMGTDAHLLPCPCSKKILSTYPCAKLWWEMMPACYPAHVLKRYCQPVPKWKTLLINVADPKQKFLIRFRIRIRPKVSFGFGFESGSESGLKSGCESRLRIRIRILYSDLDQKLEKLLFFVLTFLPSLIFKHKKAALPQLRDLSTIKVRNKFAGFGSGSIS